VCKSGSEGGGWKPAPRSTVPVERRHDDRQGAGRLPYAGTPATRDVRTCLESSTPLREPRWSPDGRRLGFLRGGPRAELCLQDAGAGPATVVARSVRTFAGWDAGGESLAYIVAGELPHRTGERWALLVTPQEGARDAVCLCAADGGGVRPPVEGLRATFPGWAPDKPTLGVWLTFEPPYTFGPADGLLRPIDPAALIDAASGALNWQPVGAGEKAQLAHHHLRRRAYDAPGESTRRSRTTRPCAGGRASRCSSLTAWTGWAGPPRRRSG